MKLTKAEAGRLGGKVRSAAQVAAHLENVKKPRPRLPTTPRGWKRKLG